MSRASYQATSKLPATRYLETAVVTRTSLSSYQVTYLLRSEATYAREKFTFATDLLTNEFFSRPYGGATRAKKPVTWKLAPNLPERRRKLATTRFPSYRLPPVACFNRSLARREVRP